MKVAIGEDSHRFDFEDKNKKLILGGVLFTNYPPLAGNSDADVVLHAITNAISGITGKNILGKIADKMCMEQGITDSKEYVREALKYLSHPIEYLSISIECKTPKISPRIEEMKEEIAKLLKISATDIGITATTGEELTEVGKGRGIHVFACITVA